MNKTVKFIIGTSVFAGVAYWMLTTKNEVVNSLVFPLKVKLGLAKYNETTPVSMTLVPATDEAPASIVIEGDNIWDKYKDKLPSIFKRTIYRLPTPEELEEVNAVPLTPSELIQGFTYTIVGRGIESREKKSKVLQSLQALSRKYPDNKLYKQAVLIYTTGTTSIMAGMEKAALVAKKNSSPSFFEQTHYRLPTDDELKEIATYDLSAQEVLQGLGFSIIGLQVGTPKTDAQMKLALIRLMELFPNKPEYKKAYQMNANQNT